MRHHYARHRLLGVALHVCEVRLRILERHHPALRTTVFYPAGAHECARVDFVRAVGSLRFEDRLQRLAVLNVIHRAAVRINVVAAVLRVVDVIHP